MVSYLITGTKPDIASKHAYQMRVLTGSSSTATAASCRPARLDRGLLANFMAKLLHSYCKALDTATVCTDCTGCAGESGSALAACLPNDAEGAVGLLGGSSAV